jgi:hypothetical protein
MSLFTNLNQFQKDIKKISEKTKTDQEKLVKKYAFEVFTEFVNRTPIDTGRAKANWFITLNTGTDEVYTGSGELGEQEATLVSLRRLKVADTRFIPDKYVISNNLDYIVPLDEGWSKQAPIGIVDLGIQTVNIKFRRFANEL